VDWLLTADQQMIQSTVRDFVNAEVVSAAGEWDRNKRFPEETFVLALRTTYGRCSRPKCSRLLRCVGYSELQTTGLSARLDQGSRVGERTSMAGLESRGSLLDMNDMRTGKRR